jgi:hypothetical protein
MVASTILRLRGCSKLLNLSIPFLMLLFKVILISCFGVLF